MPCWGNLSYLLAMQELSLVFKKYLFWWVLCLSVFIPLYPKFPLFPVPGTYVSVRVEDVLIMVVVLWWLIAFFPSWKKILNLVETEAFIVFWGIGLLSLFSGIILTQTVVPHLGFLHFFRRIEVMVLFLIALTSFENKKQFKIWLITMLVVTAVVVLYGFGQKFFSFPVISTTNKEFSKGLILVLTPDARVNSTFAGHYDLAGFLGIFLTLSSALIFYYREILKKLCLGTVSVLSFLLLSMTAARVSFVATILGVSSVLFLLGQKKLILAMLILAVFALAVFPDLRHRTVGVVTVNLLGGGGPKYIPPPQKENSTKHFSIENAREGSATFSGVPVDVAPGEPLNPTELGVYRSLGIRLNEEWPRAARAFFKNPVLGTGYSSIGVATDNDYLRSLGETGLLGTIALGLIFIYIARKMINFLRKKSKTLIFYFTVGLLCALLGILATALFIDVLESSKVAELLWLTLGVGFAAIKMEEKGET